MVSDDPDATKTLDGTVMGTPAYMSPEQAQAKPLDARSDVFSFGAVLHELLSGKRAFTGSSMVDVLSAVVRDDPAPLQAPAELQRIISRCLAKQPEKRFPSMAELRVALEKLGAKPTEQQPSLAVLPFANMSRDADDGSGHCRSYNLHAYNHGMPMFMCRWPNGDLSFVSARTKQDAIVMLDEWDNAELAELRRVPDFMVDFRLNDDGELEFQTWEKACWMSSGKKPIRLSCKPEWMRQWPAAVK